MDFIFILIALAILGGAIAVIGAKKGWFTDANDNDIPDKLEDIAEDAKELAKKVTRKKPGRKPGRKPKKKNFDDFKTSTDYYEKKRK